MAKGTLTRRAKVFASKVFPEPVGPSNNTLLLSNSTRSMLSSSSSSITRLTDSEPDLGIRIKKKELMRGYVVKENKNDNGMEDKPFYLGRMIYSFVMIVNSDREHLHNGMEGKGV